MRRTGGVAAIAAAALGLVVASCSDGEQTQTNAAKARPTPTGYAIRRVDLWADPVNDICRARDGEFLEKLMDRVRRALPIPMRVTMQFSDFNVTDGYEGKGRVATMRFTVDRDGQKGVLMYATGKFTPATCRIDQMRAGVGAAPEIGTKEITVP